MVGAEDKQISQDFKQSQKTSKMNKEQNIDNNYKKQVMLKSSTNDYEMKK